MDKLDVRVDWDTLMPRAAEAYFGSVQLEEDLKIRVRTPPEGIYEFCWNTIAYFRVRDELHGVPWDVDPANLWTGCTHQVLNSTWVKEVSENDNLVEALHPGIKHFVLLTLEIVMEVLSNREPEVIFIPQEIAQLD